MEEIFSNCYDEYIERSKVENLATNKLYQNVKEEIKELKEKYPNATKLLDYKEETTILNEDQKAIIKILELQSIIFSMENDETFKIGFREAYFFFQRMNLLKDYKKEEY